MYISQMLKLLSTESIAEGRIAQSKAARNSRSTVILQYRLGLLVLQPLSKPSLLHKYLAN